MTESLPVADQQPLSPEVRSLLDQLSDPVVASALHNLLDHADLLAILLIGVDGFIGRSEVIGEALAGSITELRGVAEENKPSVDVASTVNSLVQLSATLPKITPGLTRVADEDLIGTLLDSGITSPASMNLVGVLARALEVGAENDRKDPVKVGGVFAMMRQLKDPEVARGLGFTLSILKAVGHELDADR